MITKFNNICESILLLIITTSAHASDKLTLKDANKWSYVPDSNYGPKNWAEIAPQCGDGTTYSPLDLTFDNSQYSQRMTPAKFEGHWVKDGRPSVSLHFDKSVVFMLFHPGTAIHLRGLEFEGLMSGRSRNQNSSFVLTRCILHWGGFSGSDGSEHHVDFREAHMELQCEFMEKQVFAERRRLAKFSQFYRKDPKRLMVSTLVAFVRNPDELGIGTNTGWAQVLSKVGRISSEVTSKIALKLSLKSFLRMLSPNWDSYYMYNGSLTFPPCRQNVTWYVFTEPVILAQYLGRYLYQLQSRSQDSILGHLTIEGNNRPSQKHYNRTVWRSFAISDHVIRVKENEEIFNRMMKVLMSQNTSFEYRRTVTGGGPEIEKLPTKTVKISAVAQQTSESQFISAISQNRQLQTELNNLSRSLSAPENTHYNFSEKKLKRSSTNIKVLSTVVILVSSTLIT